MKRNYSYTYLLPLVADKVYFEKAILNNVINTYTFIQNSAYNSRAFAVQIKLEFDNPHFTKNEDALLRSPVFAGCVSLSESSLYVFNFPSEYYRDRQKFILGKYSEMSILAKKKILTHWTSLYGNNPSFITGPLTKIKQILFKESKLRERMEFELGSDIKEGAELGELINKQNETFDLSGLSLPTTTIKNNI